jgi:predicted transcriptional regulator
MASSIAQAPRRLEIGKASISQLLEELETGRVTSKELVEVSMGNFFAFASLHPYRRFAMLRT